MWSLAVEEQFYFVWPTLLLLLLLLASRFRWKLDLTATLLTLMSLVCSEVVLQFWPSTAFYHLPSRGWELLAGALVALNLFPPVQNRLLASLLSLAGLALMAGSVLLSSKTTPFPGIAALPPVLGCAVVIYAETGARTITGALLSLKPFVFLGRISYSLYLWHWPLLSLPVAVLARDLSPLETTTCVALAVAISLFSWRYIEQPFRRGAATPIRTPAQPGFLRLFAPRHNARAYFALALAAALIVPGSYVQESQGARWRFSPSARSLLETGDKDCHLGPRLIECRVGDPKKGEPGDFVLWGDSHARRYFPALSQIYENGIGFFYPGCMPVMNTIWVDAFSRPISPDCSRGKEQALAAIKKLKPKLVILAGRWSVIEGPYGLEKTSLRFHVTSTRDALSRQKSHEVFATQIRNTVNELTALGAKVVVMGQVPEMKRNVLTCIVSAMHLGLSKNHCTGIAREDVEQRQAFINKTLAELEAENPNVTVFWPIPHMCDAKTCHAVKDGQLLYTDGDHISVEGATLLRDAIKKTLMAMRSHDMGHAAAAYHGVSD
jgi:peptidoglycan/LPS O-acetylase OafA/YrhL